MKNKLLDFESSHVVILKSAKEHDIKGYNDWQKKYIKSPFFPNGVPKQPQITYKNKGWISWGHWLGTGSISNVERNKGFKSYNDAKNWIKKNTTVTSKKQWYKYVESGLLPESIPVNPQRTYKGRGWHSWQEWLDTDNVRGGYSCRKYTANFEFFKTWSSDMAYVLGFWWADGCMKDHRRFSIYQHNKDKYILDNILSVMESDYPIAHDKRNCCYFEIGSKILCDSILKLGGKCRKSHDIDFPLDMPLDFAADFLRGHFDGDGCITFDKNCRKHFAYISSASPFFMNALRIHLANVGIKISHVSASISVKMNAENTIKFGNYIYYPGFNQKLTLVRKLSIYQGITGFGHML